MLAARALLADPDLPKKARAGKADEIRPCIRCFECFAGITTKRQYRCAVNPEIGFEQDSRHALPADRTRRRCWWSGGGVAGHAGGADRRGARPRGDPVREGRAGWAARSAARRRCRSRGCSRDYLDYQARMVAARPDRRAAGHRGDARARRRRPAPTSSSPRWAPARAYPRSPASTARTSWGRRRPTAIRRRSGATAVVLGGGLGRHRTGHLPLGPGPHGHHPGDDGDPERRRESRCTGWR